MDHLKDADHAIVTKRKIVEYLLSRSHATGRSKSRYFEKFGFSVGGWRELRSALLNHARHNTVVSVEETSFGTKYVVEGRLRTPDGRDPNVRSVWFIETGEVAPRFVTAYPQGRPDH